MTKKKKKKNGFNFKSLAVITWCLATVWLRNSIRPQRRGCVKMENVRTLLCLLHCICSAAAAREHIVRGSSPLFPLFSSFRSAAISHHPSACRDRSSGRKNNKKKRRWWWWGGKSGGSLFYSWKNKPPVAAAVLLIISLPSVSTGYHGGRWRL